MKYRKVEDGYLLRLEKGEEVVETLTAFIKNQKIQAGFITGMGAVNPLGCGVVVLWKGLLEGRSGVGYVESFNAKTYPSRIGGECRSFDHD